MRSVLVAAGAAVLLVVLSGCDGPPPRVTPVPTPSVTPVFASDEEALAAAEESYAAYVAASEAISAKGWLHPEELSQYVTAAELQRTKDRFAELASTGRHTQGSATIENASLQRYDLSEVTIYLCVDVSQVRILDSSGHDVTPIDRPNRAPLEVTFDIVHDHLLLDSSDVWEGGDICDG